MSGITGFNREDKTLLNKALNLIKHRGPDDEKFYINSEFSMGIRMTILSNKFILNPPIHNEQEDIWLICDGEIYNFLEIETLLEKKGHKFYTDNSSEVIVHAYEEWDCLCVEKFRGEFVFCIYDFRKNLIFLARDPIGIKTLYYYFDGKNFIFGSEIKSILCHDIKKEFNKRAFGLYLSLRYVPFEITMFKGIRKVPNSCYLLFDLKDKSIKIRRYWDYIFDINRNKTEAQFADELKNLIIDSIKIRLRKNLPIGAFLSGGLDSSAVVGVLSKLLDKPVRTFSIGFEEGAPINEIKYAKLVADFNGCDHTELNIKSNFLEDLTKIVWYNDDLIADAALIPVYLMGKEVKKHLDIVFTGDGADEVFAGYSVYYRNQISKYEDHIPKQLIELSMKFNKQIPSYKLRLAVNYINKSKNLEDRYIRALLQVPDAEKSNFVPFKVDNVESLIKGKLIKDLDIINRFTHWDLKY